MSQLAPAPGPLRGLFPLPEPFALTAARLALSLPSGSLTLQALLGTGCKTAVFPSILFFFFFFK